jgi:hypothetical protein
VGLAMQNNLFRHSMSSVPEAAALGIVLNFTEGKSVPANSGDSTVAIAAVWLVFYIVILGSSVIQ